MRIEGVVLTLVAACGRINFDPQPSGPLDSFEPAMPFDGNAALASDDDAALSGDMLEIVFDSERAGTSGDLYVATRATASAPWSMPVVIAELATPDDEDSPWLSIDGLLITFASARPGGLGGFDLYTASRIDRASGWSAPAHIGELATTTAEQELTLSGDQLLALFASTRPGGAGGHDLYETVRASPTDSWGPPRRVAELASAVDEIAPFIDATGTLVVFSSVRDGDSDIYVATRASRAAPFDPPMPPASVNTDESETDPWLSPDQRTIAFTRGTNQARDIYFAQRP